MLECKAAEKKTFFQSTEVLTVEAPGAGVILGNHSIVTVIPQVVKPGVNHVMAIRRTAMATVQEGDVVGIVLPFEDECSPYTEEEPDSASAELAEEHPAEQPAAAQN